MYGSEAPEADPGGPGGGSGGPGGGLVGRTTSWDNYKDFLMLELQTA